MDLRVVVSGDVLREAPKTSNKSDNDSNNNTISKDVINRLRSVYN